MKNVGRWISTPLVVLAAFCATALTAGVSASLARIRPDYVGGFFAAVAVVASAYLAAPTAKLIVAFTAFAVGAWVATGWLRVDTGEFSGRHLVLGPINSALGFTLLGGVFALVTVVVVDLRRRARARSADSGAN